LRKEEGGGTREMGGLRFCRERSRKREDKVRERREKIK